MLAALLATRGIVVSSLFPPNGIIDLSYAYQLTEVGGSAPYTWSRLSGSLPPGLILSSSGLISGTPTTIGVFTFVVQVADASAATAFAILTILVGSYGRQFIAATTTFPCIAFARRAAALTTNPAIAQELLFSSSSQYAVRDALAAQYQKLISQNSSDDPVTLSHNIFQTIPVVLQLNSIMQMLPVAPANMTELTDLQQRTQYALMVLQQDLFVFPE